MALPGLAFAAAERQASPVCVGGAQVRSYCATARNGFDRAQSQGQKGVDFDLGWIIRRRAGDSGQPRQRHGHVTAEFPSNSVCPSADPDGLR